ncbi:hypothetical protein DMA11_14515 [Marinilabiliaceae bacterium JC017]|nr:hypothetical protein DMA11_14515 [Marinilabiliaceae bacterium JC017]
MSKYLHMKNKETHRKQAYESFRSFYKDSAQDGETLSSASPIRLAATRSLITRRTTLLREAFKPDTKVMATSLLVPSEIVWALDCIPLNLEMFSSLLASHSKIIELANKGSLTAPRCSFINSLKGAFHENLIPIPDVLFSSSAYCEGISYVFEDLKAGFGSPHFHLELPVYPSYHSIRDLAVQLKQLFRRLAGVLDLDINEAFKNFRKAMYNSALARKEFLDMWEFRKSYGPLNLGLEPLHWHMQFLPMWGDEKAISICQRLNGELQSFAATEIPDDNGLPIGFFGLIPYGRTEVWSMLKEYGAYMAFEGVNFLGDYVLPDLNNFDKLSLDALFENLAINLINVPVRGGNIIEKSNFFMKEAKEMGAKGMMIISHEHCQLLAPRLHELEKEATRHGLGVVSLGGDCILGMPKGPTSFRLKTFLSAFDNKEIVVEQASNEVMEEASVCDFWRLGVDFGSGFSKYILLDERQDIIKQGMFYSGIDYPGLLKEITKNLSLHATIKMGVAGVGSDHPVFRNMVHRQTTEINALIHSCKNLFPQREELLVIDIGTQDVKILHFNGMNVVPWINTNKSCGAGTGMVLVQILERWKQTVPDISFETLDALANEAGKSEVINTTCGIFAVTNVVSALVQADAEKRKGVLRGVYEYVGTQAIRLLPSELQKGGEVLLTGGIANHKTLQKVFREKGFELLNLSENLHPQYLVAYGTALSIQ